MMMMSSSVPRPMYIRLLFGLFDGHTRPARLASPGRGGSVVGDDPAVG
jgi:hypothetical protein